MGNPVCMVHIKDPLLLIGKSSPCSGSSRFALLLSDWSFISQGGLKWSQINLSLIRSKHTTI